MRACLNYKMGERKRLMKWRVALAGELPSDAELFGIVDRILGQIREYLCPPDGDAPIQLVVSRPYTGAAWFAWNAPHGFPLMSYRMRGDADDGVTCAQTVQTDTVLRNQIGEAICDRSDILIAVWKEDVMEMSGATWELLKIAYERETPCIWISAKTKQIYCLWESFYKKYSEEYLKAVCGPVERDGLRPIEIEEKSTWFMNFWQKRYERYLKKYKAYMTEYPSEQDRLLKQDYQSKEAASQQPASSQNVAASQQSSASREAVRRLLLDQFQRFDSAAVRLNQRFRAILYQRSILPFVATVFLAIGFYVETLVGGMVAQIVPTAAAEAELLTGLLAGTGFLIHGYINLHAYRMSKDPLFFRYREGFAYNRYVAEILRVMIHVTPYGVELDLRKLCGKDRKLYGMLRHVADDVEPGRQKIDTSTARELLEHMEEMLENQSAYHEASGKRYRAIVDSLKKWQKKLFYLGFVMILVRAILQFALSVLSAQGTQELFLDSGMLKSFLNMLALLLPAWAGYFTSKLQQNHFQYNLENHENMVSKLRVLRERVARALEQEDISTELFVRLTEDSAQALVVEDTIGWNRKYRETSINPL